MQRLYLYDYTTTHGALTLESLHEHCTEELSVLNDEFPDELDLSGFLGRLAKTISWGDDL